MPMDFADLIIYLIQEGNVVSLILGEITVSPGGSQTPL